MNFMRIFLCALFIVILSSCLPPGKGAKAERGYAAAAPIIAALENYHRENNEYPASLDQLVPKFMDRDKLTVKLARDQETSFKYRQIKDSYELSFGDKLGYSKGEHVEHVLIIFALADYHRENGKYPESLDQLVPKFLTRDELTIKLPNNQEISANYRRKVEDSYELSFYYYGPASNTCTYNKGGTKAWDCYGLW